MSGALARYGHGPTLTALVVLVFATMLSGCPQTVRNAEDRGPARALVSLSSPAVSGEPNEDGLLTMTEILGLELDADWVVLSACNTAGTDGRGAEAVSGLGRAFFHAGARALLVTQWPVETTSAKMLTTTLFRLRSQDPTLTRAAALRGAMLELLDRGGRLDGSERATFSYAHPIFWAPFALVGR